jgi:hypothetical protein
MYILACDVNWQLTGAGASCPGTLVSVPRDELGAFASFTPEDYAQVRGDIIVLFATVFGVLALKKALK